MTNKNKHFEIQFTETRKEYENSKSQFTKKRLKKAQERLRIALLTEEFYQKTFNKTRKDYGFI